jgi:poly(ADP-ribose) glycohydrolase
MEKNIDNNEYNEKKEEKENKGYCELPCWSIKYNERWKNVKDEFSKKITNIKELQESLKIIHETDYFSKGSLYQHLEENEEFSKEFFELILPTLQKNVLNMNNLFPKDKLPKLLIYNEEEEEQILTLTRIQISCLMSASFFGLLKAQKYEKNQFHGKIHIGNIIFNNFFGGKGKFFCLLNYFKRISKKEPKGNISFHRKRVKDINFENGDKKFTKLDVNSKNIIEDFDYHLKVDFANKYIGGGVLGGGDLQEEISKIIKN